MNSILYGHTKEPKAKKKTPKTTNGGKYPVLAMAREETLLNSQLDAVDISAMLTK